MKTCLWCANPCEEYYKVIAPKANEMGVQDAESFRIQTAYGCEKYIQRPETPTQK